MKSYHPDVISALAAPNVRLVMFIKLVLDDITVYYCTVGQDIVWDNQTWNGMGAVLGVDTISETGRVEALGWRVTLSGVPSDLLALALLEDVQGRPAYAYIGAYNEAGAMVASPTLEYYGEISHMDIDDQPDNAQVVLSIESALVSKLGAENSLWTHAEQTRLYPGPPPDRGFFFVNTVAERTLAFGPKA